MHDICENIEEYNPNKEPKILNIFDDMIADMLFVTQSYVVLPNVRLNSTNYFIVII